MCLLTIFPLFSNDLPYRPLLPLLQYPPHPLYVVELQFLRMSIGVSPCPPPFLPLFLPSFFPLQPQQQQIAKAVNVLIVVQRILRCGGEMELDNICVMHVDYIIRWMDIIDHSKDRRRDRWETVLDHLFFFPSGHTPAESFGSLFIDNRTLVLSLWNFFLCTSQLPLGYERNERRPIGKYVIDCLSL